MAEDTFPILWQGGREYMQELRDLGCPRAAPWSLVAPHGRQAWENHGQSLERLAQRGGLSPRELVAVLRGVAWHEVSALPLADAVREINSAATTVGEQK